MTNSELDNAVRTAIVSQSTQISEKLIQSVKSSNDMNDALVNLSATIISQSVYTTIHALKEIGIIRVDD